MISGAKDESFVDCDRSDGEDRHAEAMIRCAALQAAATIIAGAQLWSMYTPEQLAVKASGLAEAFEVRLRRPR